MTNNETKEWYLIDAKDKILGRVATEIADLLRGKKKVDFAPNKDGGDYVVVVNADSFVLSGKKEDQKRYYKHTGYLGNLKTFTVPEMKTKKPGDMLTLAVSGMLPKNRLRAQFLKRLRVYTTPEHDLSNVKFKNQK